MLQRFGSWTYYTTVGKWAIRNVVLVRTLAVPVNHGWLGGWAGRGSRLSVWRGFLCARGFILFGLVGLVWFPQS